jgi:hypothetical protein
LAKKLRNGRFHRGKEVVLGVVTMVLSVSLTFVIVEIVLRVILPSSDVDLFVYRTDTIRYKVMKPNVSGHVYGVPFETNDQGFRAQNSFQTAKDPGGVRIMVIGDSFTVGTGVPFSKTVTAQLEEEWGNQSNRHSVEVLNVAVAGHCILHHLATLKEVCLSYDPDLIIVFLFPTNDFYAEHYERDRLRAISGGQDNESGIRDRVKKMYMTRVFWPRVHFLLRQIGPVDRMLGSDYGVPRVLSSMAPGSTGRERSEEALREMADLTRRRGIPLKVFMLPSNFGKAYEEQREVHETAAQICESAGLPAISLLDRFEYSGKPPKSYTLNIIDSHPNVEYCSLVRDAVLDELRDDLSTSDTDKER